MNPVFKNSVLILLAILQFISPLVHAHTGSNFHHAGIHVPGLEHYVIRQDAPVLHDVNATLASEGLLVQVDAGIRDVKDLFAHHADPEFYFSGETLSPAKLPLVSRQNFSPHKHTSHTPAKSSAPQAPRAPPLKS